MTISFKKYFLLCGYFFNNSFLVKYYYVSLYQRYFLSKLCFIYFVQLGNLDLIEIN